MNDTINIRLRQRELSSLLVPLKYEAVSSPLCIERCLTNQPIFIIILALGDHHAIDNAHRNFEPHATGVVAMVIVPVRTHRAFNYVPRQR